MIKNGGRESLRPDTNWIVQKQESLRRARDVL